MDERGMRELFEGYLGELNWAGGLSKADILNHLVGRDEALQSLVGHYVAEGTYASPGEVVNVIPEQAWQDAQGDVWRGASFADTGDAANSHFLEGAAGQDSPGNP